MFSQLLVEASKERQNERVAMFTKTDSGGGDDSDILEKLSEYLFDLFDANLTKDFQKMEAFEQKACQIFDPNEEEYNFQQTEMHEQFKLLFEELTESFLTENGCNREQLYEIAKDCIANKKTTSSPSASCSRRASSISACASWQIITRRCKSAGRWPAGLAARRRI